jgi:hypothetical protein
VNRKSPSQLEKLKQALDAGIIDQETYDAAIAGRFRNTWRPVT